MAQATDVVALPGGPNQNAHTANSTQAKLDLLESITVTWLQLLGKPASQQMATALNPNKQAPH
jgi:hypothetical protein